MGEEGFFGPNDPNVKCNPGYAEGASWPAYEGQDFTNNHRSKDIDFTVCPKLLDMGHLITKCYYMLTKCITCESAYRWPCSLCDVPKIYMQGTFLPD